jgi:hypothetical protein
MISPRPVRRSLLLSGHQPVYLPGIIFFNKVALSDIFMFVGHCQLTRKSWHSRNRIRLGDRELWLSIPIKTAGQYGQAINDAEFVDVSWKRKHLGSIRQAYLKAPFYDCYYPKLERMLLQPWENLGDLNIAFIRLIASWLEIDTPLVDGRAYTITGEKTEMLISMCRAVNADRYLSNEGSIVYVDEERLADCGIQHCWQKFEHPSYDQGGVFMPNMSVIDLLFRSGPGAGDLVRNCGRVSPGAFAPKV